MQSQILQSDSSIGGEKMQEDRRLFAVCDPGRSYHGHTHVYSVTEKTYLALSKSIANVHTIESIQESQTAERLNHSRTDQQSNEGDPMRSNAFITVHQGPDVLSNDVSYIRQMPLWCKYFHPLTILITLFTLVFALACITLNYMQVPTADMSVGLEWLRTVTRQYYDAVRSLNSNKGFSIFVKASSN